MPKSSTKRPTLIDVDTGIDDALALIVASYLSDSLEICSVTTVAGNVGIDDATENTRAVLGLLGRGDMLIAKGAAGPIAHDWTTSAQVHGERGLGTLKRSDLLSGPELSSLSAVELILQQARLHSGELLIVATGPLTNLALALLAYPDLREHVANVVVMGGAFERGGNVSPVAEYNFYVDPLAADIVMTSGLDVTLIPLDTTHQVLVSQGRLESWRARLGLAGRPAVAAFALEALDFYVTAYGAAGKGAAAMHDPVAVIAAARPDLFAFRESPVRVEARDEVSRGQSVRTSEPASGAGLVKVPASVDSAGCLEILCEAIFA